MSEFDSYAHDYETSLERGISVSGENAKFFAKERIAWLARCLQKLRVEPTRVLDFGCGTGSATEFLFDVLGAESLIGIDESERSLAVARDNADERTADFRRTDDYAPDGSIRVAYCNGVFHHVPKLDRPSVVRYIADSLGEGGVFSLWENNPWSPAARYVMSRIPFDRDAVMVWPREARRLMRDAGLRVLRTDYRFIFPSSLGFLRPTERCVGRVPLGAQYQVLAQKVRS